MLYVIVEGEIDSKTESISHDFKGEIDSKTQYLGFRLVAPEKKRKEIIMPPASQAGAKKRAKISIYIHSPKKFVSTHFSTRLS